MYECMCVYTSTFRAGLHCVPQCLAPPVNVSGYKHVPDCVQHAEDDADFVCM